MEKGYPLKKSAWMIRGFKKSSSDDRPGPGICGSKYVEDAKAARSVRVWDRVPMKNKVGGIKKERAERQGLGQSPNEKNKTKAVSPLWSNLVALSLPLYRGSKRDL